MENKELSVDELKTLLKEKEGEGKEKCSFKPTKGKEEDRKLCGEIAEFNYGERSFCKKHKRTVQALNCKKEYDEQQERVKIEEQAKIMAEQIAQEAKKAETAKDTGVENSTGKEAKKTKTSDIKDIIEEEVKTAKTKAAKKATVVKRNVKRNRWGRYEDEETRILFNPQTKEAFGLQDHKTGGVLPLDVRAVNICKKYHWKYVIIDVEEEDTDDERSSSSSTSSEEKSSEERSSSSDDESGSNEDDDDDESGSNEDEDDDESGSNEDDDEDESGSNEDEDEDEDESGSGDEGEPSDENESGSNEDEDESGSNEDEDESGSNDEDESEDETSSSY